ncbi:MAG TPA: VWA domain-containing protein [Bryobacteraceae bacterium]|nr:VWA domain-containing protein [Bryobacteraceae bacterium]
MTRLVLISLLSGLLVAQQPSQSPQTGQQSSPQAQPPQQPPPDVTRFGTTVEYVVAPTLVFDRDDQYVSGIRKDQFRLFDNGKEQNINVDETFVPISLVVCIQANSHVEGLLPQVKKIGNLLSPLILGDQGEAAIIAYDARIRVLQPFTHDPDLITKQVKGIYPGSQSNRLIDAVVEGTRMLQSRPKDRRRIMLVIGETRDVGSESRAREALIGLQVNNIIFYSVDMSRFLTTLTAPPPVGRPDNNPPALHSMPGLVPATPTTVAQATGANAGRAEFIPLMVEIFKDVKAIFVDNPVELFTKGTGGSEFGFHSQRTLEEAMLHVSEELHSEYTISYSPNNTLEGGFHHITVDVTGHPEVKRTQTRPGYWLAAKK